MVSLNNLIVNSWFLVVLIFSLLYGVKTKNYFKETFKSENQTNDFDNRTASMKNYQKTSAGHLLKVI